MISKENPVRNKRPRLRAFALAAAFILAGVPWGTARAEDFNPQPDPPGFGMFGITRGQTARLHVAIVGVDEHNPPADHNPPSGRPGPWHVTLSFYNGDGRLLAQSSESVELGRAASLDFVAPAMPLGARMRIRAALSVDRDANGIVPCVKPAVEVLNNDTGRSAFIYEGSSDGDRTHDHGSSLVGIARGQVARLNVVNLGVFPQDPNVPPDICRVTLTFVDGGGNVLSQVTKSVDFNRAAFLDLSWSDVPPDPYHRLQVRALVNVEPNAAGQFPSLKPTLEVFNTETGMTTILIQVNRAALLPAV
jgi:hypothetical protein